MNVAANIAGTRHISLRAVISCFWFTYSRWRRVWALALWQRSESSHRRRGRAEPAVFGGWGARRFLVDIWGLAESLVPAYTSSSIFCEKLRSGDAGERDSVSGERGSSSGVSGDCDVLSWLPRLFSRKSSLGVSLGAVVIRHSLHVMSSVGRAQPGCP